MRELLALAAESIARLESSGTIREKRLTDPEFRAWQHFRRKLGWRDFVELLLEDAALLFPVPFDTLLARLNAGVGSISEAEAEAMLRSVAAQTEKTEEAGAFLARAARALGRPAGGRLSDLPRIQAYEKVLELPGTSGRAAFALCRQWTDLSFGSTFTFLVEGDADLVLAGLAAVEARSREVQVISRPELLARGAAGQRFDRVIGHSERRPAGILVDELATGGVVWL